MPKQSGSGRRKRKAPVGMKWSPCRRYVMPDDCNENVSSDVGTTVNVNCNSVVESTPKKGRAAAFVTPAKRAAPEATPAVDPEIFFTNKNDQQPPTRAGPLVC